MMPYGYAIEDGRAVVDADAASRIRRFAEGYLSGLSVAEANRAAGIPLGGSSLYNLLENRTLLGTDYYPAIFTEEEFLALQAERKRRTHPATLSASAPMPVKEKFRLEMPLGESREGDAGEDAAYLYSLIVPSENGGATASPSEMGALRRWVKSRTAKPRQQS